ncbi:hypothetical protein R1flu_017115 [Riccia fluitans]|uniref:Protein kinase domain-containing protein n=1 Tax=Riccia fluitans TaxID=41844 RepID=A0ABD1YPR7_9MARC
MGTVGSIIGAVCAAIALIGIAGKVYWWCKPRRNSPRSPKETASTVSGSSRSAWAPCSFMCPAENDVELGVAFGSSRTLSANSHAASIATTSSSRSMKASKFSQKSSRDLPEPAVKSKSYTFEEMRTCTNHFSSKIGQGRFGPVYRGQLSAKEVAVKVIARNSGQGASEFVREVDFVANLHHDNLVPLVGHCQESPHQMLIYEYISNGTLQDHLHNQDTQALRPCLTWQQRLHIALDVAEALEYLHKTGRAVTIHGDVKPKNILLDDKLNAKVSDFGISKFASVDNSGVPTQVFGTPGYIDPEFSTTKYMTAKSDVYSLGVVLLELISGRPSTQLNSQGKPDSMWDLTDWGCSLIRAGNLRDLVDPALRGAYEKQSLAKVVLQTFRLAIRLASGRFAVTAVFPNRNMAKHASCRGHVGSP